MGPGSLLGGRYLVGGRMSVHPRFERWTADDQALMREVVVLCFPTESVEASAAIDSARRAAGVEEVRLVRVLDVGESDGVSFVVEEPLPGARSLTSLVATDGLPSEEARRLVGEAASALESARIRGLHHGALGPRSVLVQGDGAIKVRGLATEAALLGLDETDSRTALRTDAVALVALTYAALTGRWPLPSSVTGADPGLQPAPTLGSGVAAPAELASGVPADLDTLARLTLNHDQGPRSPGDLAAQLAPWSPTAYAVALARPASAPIARLTSAAADPVAAPVTPARRSRGRTVLGIPVAGAAPVPADTAASTGPAAGIPVAAAAAPLPAAGSSGPTPWATGPSGGAVATVGAAQVSAAPSTEPSTEPGTASSTEPSTEQAIDRAIEAHTARATDGESGAWDDDLDDLDEPAAVVADGRQPGVRTTGPMRIVQDVRLSETLETGDEDDLEPPVPLGSGGGALGRDQSKIALIVVAVLVVVAAVIGFTNLTRGHSTPPAAVATIPAVAAPTTAAATTAPPTSTVTAAPSSDIAITNAQAWDPQGDGQEGNATAPRAYDGNLATVWQSQTYSSAKFGGYAKSGIGLVFDLGQETQVHQVVTTLRGGADFTVYLANRLSLDGATSIGSSSGQDGAVTIGAPGGTAKGTLVIIWFTKLAPDSAGGFSAQVAEVKVS